MSLNREAVYSALWSMILEAPGIQGQFVTTARLLQHIEDVSQLQMPALFLLQQGETWRNAASNMQGRIPAVRTLNASLLFYVFSQTGDEMLPATRLNNAMDAIDNLFNQPSGQTVTLGGLVQHVYVGDGEVRFYEGLLQEKSPAVVPLRILVP